MYLSDQANVIFYELIYHVLVCTQDAVIQA